MKKFTSLLISCSLALAGAAMAQEPSPEASPVKKQRPGKGARQAAEAPAGANAAKASADAQAPQRGPAKQKAAANAPAAATTKAQPTASGEAGATAGQPAATSARKGQAQQRGRGGKANKKDAQGADPAAASQQDPATATATSSAVAPAGKPAGQRQAGGAKKKPDPQQVQQIKNRHANFRAQPRPQQIPAVTFQQNYRIAGAERWQGPQYEVYRSYRPERHDRNWYSSRYNRVELIGGGYYYWNNGYWFPAWGYSPQAEYYAYDAPIYVGQRAEPPDRVIATVQATLQEMGHYRGEVDGLLGPLTREALVAYQREQGLVATAVMDQPTLDSLGMG